MSRNRGRRYVQSVMLLALAAFLWGCSPELGQLGGIAKDRYGKVLSFAEVTLGPHMTTTNVQGQYQFIDVQPGFYELSVNAKGFYSHQAILDVLPGVQRMDFILTPQPARTAKSVEAAQGSDSPDPEVTAQPQSKSETVAEAPTAPTSTSTATAQETATVQKEVIIPDFKLPLPGGYDWLLSTEPGGGFYGGDPNLGHRGRSYFSLDIIDNNRQRGELHGFPVPILAAADGEVIEVRNNVICQGCQFGYGNYVKIDHGNGFTAIYAHLRYPSVNVEVSDKVRQGQTLAFMGNTGHSTGIHLHFEIRYLNQGIKQADILGGVMMDGVSLSKYKVGTVARPKYYTSTQNLP